MQSIEITKPLNAATISKSSDAVASVGAENVFVEFRYTLLPADRIELTAVLVQYDPRRGRTDYDLLCHVVTEREYAADEACDVHAAADDKLAELGISGWRTGKFAEAVEAAVDRAARVPAIAAE